MEINKIGQKFSQKIGMADIIESKGIANISRVENSRMPTAHEDILFTTVSGNPDLIVPQLKIASMLDESKSTEENNSKEMKNKRLSDKWSHKSSLNI